MYIDGCVSPLPTISRSRRVPAGTGPDSLRRPRPMATRARRRVFSHGRLTIDSPMPYPHPVGLRTIFDSLLTAQHSSHTRFRTHINNLLSMPTAILHSPATGYLATSLQYSRHVLVATQLADQHTTRFPDPLGIRILAAPDSRIALGTPIAAIRHAATLNPEAMLQALRPAFSILPEPPPPLLPMEIVS